MADDSMIIETVMDFHPSDPPCGMKDYVLSDLTTRQKTKLLYRKRDKVRSDEQYLANHPEIRGIIAMILRLLMRTRPKYDICDVIGQYFTKSSVDLKEEVYSYVDEKKNVFAANSTIIYNKTSVGESILTEIEEEVDEDLEELMGVDDMEERGDEKDVDRLTGIRWGNEKVEDEEDGSEKEHIEKICKEILEQILEKIFEEEDTISMGSIASIGFPVDYEDHAYSLNSEDSNDDDD